MLPHDGQPTELDLRTSAGSGAITTSRMLAERAIGPCPPKALPDRTTVNVTGLLSTSRPARPDPARRRRRTAHTTRARQRAAPALRGTLQMNCTSARSALRPGLRTTVAPLCSASRQNDFAGTNASSAASLPGLTWPPPRTSTNARAAALRPTEASTTCTPAKPTINTIHNPRRHNRHRPPYRLVPTWTHPGRARIIIHRPRGCVNARRSTARVVRPVVRAVSKRPSAWMTEKGRVARSRRLWSAAACSVGWQSRLRNSRRRVSGYKLKHAKTAAA